MQLLEKASNAPSQEDIIKFNKMSGVAKDAFIQEYLSKQPNYKNLKNNLADYVAFIAKYGWEHPYTTYILGLERPLSQGVAKTIEDLSVNKVLNPTNLFLKDNSLWTENDSETIYKIKVLSMLSNPTYKRKYSDIEDFKISSMKDVGGNFLSASQMQDKLNQWQKQLDTKYGRSSRNAPKTTLTKNEEDAVSALENAGLNKNDATTLVKGLQMGNYAVENIINAALRASR